MFRYQTHIPCPDLPAIPFVLQFVILVPPAVPKILLLPTPLQNILFFDKHDTYDAVPATSSINILAPDSVYCIYIK